MALNLYRYAVKASWERSGEECDRLAHLLDSVVMLLPSAWSGGMVSDALAKLEGFQADAKSVSGAVTTMFEQTWALEPAEVPMESWKYSQYV